MGDKQPFTQTIPYVLVEKASNQGVYQEDTIIAEERIALYLNGSKIIATMSIPKDQDAHAIGFLLSEGVIESIDDVKNISIAPDGLSVYVDAKINPEHLQNLYHEKTLTSGCCVGVTGNFEGKIIEKFIATQMQIPIGWVWELLESFEVGNLLFHTTGCVHQAVLHFLDGTSIHAQDIGRHNAIDKVMGKARLARKDTTQAVLFVSGRLSMEMVIKAAMHDIAILISRAAVTQLGIKTAQMLGITLIGFARNDKCNIYTHPSRILLDQTHTQKAAHTTDSCYLTSR
ncbi:sufurtransferase FdhD [Helicobacter sp. 12S02634-8]|uniref:formate dehydrogenase accessory sulfurtransferase FdhD n=1 Tax=Helicobacter sp. 12S02634-8 TaxID=1476199 RepID=UPI000BA7C688|nr:formate dehydrogenase accessory sulfurtransferase FdhD [Helicobacter sp. 12S02634-8]PAF46445.1 sufurtransferase FdhD [Helicobacter sp. 12S02634-8]